MVLGEIAMGFMNGFGDGEVAFWWAVYAADKIEKA